MDAKWKRQWCSRLHFRLPSFIGVESKQAQTNSKNLIRQIRDELVDLKKNGDLRKHDIDILKKQQESKIAI
jgi:hypothetical protein